jgi:nucleoside-diphosphate-sugar epimerase
MTNRRILLIALTAALVVCGIRPQAADPRPAQGGVLVFGGAGNLGADIVKALVSTGSKVTVFVKPSTDRARLAGLPVAFAEGDARVDADVRRAFAAAKFAVAINALARRDGETGFWDGTQVSITAAAKATGVKQVIFLSSVGVGDSAATYAPAAYERAKTGLIERGKAEDDLKASGLSYAIIRTGAVLRVGTPPTGTARLTEDQNILGPVTRPDVAKLVVDCMRGTSCRNKTLHATDDSLKIPARE